MGGLASGYEVGAEVLSVTEGENGVRVVHCAASDGNEFTIPWIGGDIVVGDCVRIQGVAVDGLSDIRASVVDSMPERVLTRGEIGGSGFSVNRWRGVVESVESKDGVVVASVRTDRGSLVGRFLSKDPWIYAGCTVDVVELLLCGHNSYYVEHVPGLE